MGKPKRIDKKPSPVARFALRRLAIAASLPLFAQALCAHAETIRPTRFNVTVEGTGPDVIMIPGLASSSTVWQPEAEKLKAHYRLHLVQVNGFAGAPSGANANGPIIVPLVEDLAAYVRANGLNHPAIIGHSIGGLLGLMLTDKHPEVVGKLMIVDSLPFFGMLLYGPGATVGTVAPLAAALRDKVIGESQADYAASEPQMMAGLVKSKGPEAQAAIAAAQASDHTVVARAMYEDFTTDLRPELAKINTPIIMLYPYDPAIASPQATVDALYQAAYASLPNKRILRIDNSFHFIQIDQPDAFDHEVQSFLSAP